jgi:hypothetical protein
MNPDDRVERMRAILFRDWDPLELNDNQCLANEYDRYIPDILRLLDGNCTVGQLERRLPKMEAEEMGLSLAPEKTTRAAREVISSWTASSLQG